MIHFAHIHIPQRLQPLLLDTVDTAYGGMNGFNQAVWLMKDRLASLQLVEEQKVIG